MHPRIGTEKNIDTFRRQLKMPGFGYDWQRELATTDVDYFRWTQWIFLQIYDTCGHDRRPAGRPISELPIPPDVKTEGAAAVAPIRTNIAWPTEFGAVNWCPALADRARQRRSDRRQERTAAIRWCGCRCGNGCCESRPTPNGWKRTSKGWIGPTASKPCSATGSAEHREDGAGIRLGGEVELRRLETNRMPRPASRQTSDDVLRVYTTRPDTLFARPTWCSPEHPLVERSDAAEQQRRDAYRQKPPPRAISTARNWPKRRPASSRCLALNPGQRPARADLDRRLRAGQLWDRRDHGRPAH